MEISETAHESEAHNQSDIEPCGETQSAAKWIQPQASSVSISEVMGQPGGEEHEAHSLQLHTPGTQQPAGRHHDGDDSAVVERWPLGKVDGILKTQG